MKYYEIIVAIQHITAYNKKVERYIYIITHTQYSIHNYTYTITDGSGYNERAYYKTE